MHLDGYKYWLAYKKGTKSYYRCSRSKSQKCPGKLIMENSKIISSIPHDHDKEARNNVVEKFRKVLTKKAIEKPNKSLVDIYLEETLNHSEASILYPFTQAESTMRKARSKTADDKSKSDEKSSKNEVKLKKNEEGQQGSSFKSQQHQKYFYVEDIGNDMQVILMNQGTLKILGKIEEVHIDCGLKGDLKVEKVKECGNLQEELDKAKGLNDNNKKESIQNPDGEKCSITNDQLFTNNEMMENGSSCRNLYLLSSEASNCQNLEQTPFLNHQTKFNDQGSITNSQKFNQISFKSSSIFQEVNYQEIYSQNLHNSANDCTNMIKSSENYSCDIIPASSEQIFESVQFYEQDKNAFSGNIDFGFVKQSFGEVGSDYGGKSGNIFDFAESVNTNQDSESKAVENSQIVSQKSIQVQDRSKVHNYEQYFEVIEAVDFNKTHENPPELAKFVENSKNSQKTTQIIPNNQQNPSALQQDFQKSNNPSNRVHIITIIALIKGRDCPIAFGLLKSINFESLHDFLNFIKHKISLNPTIILTNQNHILQQSIHSMWPESNLKIMYFYYAQSVMKNLKKNFQEIARNIFEISSLKMILSMPMIPTNYVIPGWEALRKWMSEKNVNLDCLCEDVYVNWFAENAERISIFNGLTHSINNHTQVFQSELLNSFDGNEMSLEQLTDKISRQATKNFIKFTKTSEGSVKKIQKLQKTVKIATKNWISSPFHLRRPIQFLQQVSHCIDDGMMSFVMNFEGSFCEVRKLEPPPLVFLVKEPNAKSAAVNQVQKSKVNVMSEPPPLVAIRR